MIDQKKIEETVRKYAIKNAIDYGKANQGAVIGKLIANMPNVKGEIKQHMGTISKIISDVNNMSKEDIEKEFSNYTFEQKVEKKKELELPNATMGNVITRFPPEPAGYLHIGHAKAIFLNRTLADRYNGKMVLRFDDTNPEKSKGEFIDVIKNDFEWLGVKPDKISYTSDHMDLIYKNIEKLISIGKAYVCTCSQEKIHIGRSTGKSCGCRQMPIDEQIKRWEKMKNTNEKQGYKKGEAIVRYKGDLKAVNTVMRDPTLARIIRKEHYRQGKKYVVWPNYDISVVTMDALEGITHPMRSKEYELRDELYYTLCDDLGYKRPTLVEFSRLSIKNNPVSKRLIRPLVEEKKVSGWDDPRLMTIDGLRRRGIQPEVIKKFVLSFGLGKSESNPNLELLLTHNKKFVDPIAKRYFAVIDPVNIHIETNAIETGTNDEDISSKSPKDVFVQKKDIKDIQNGEMVRLKNLYDIKRRGNKWIGHRTDISKKTKIIQWVPKEAYREINLVYLSDLFNDDGSFNQRSKLNVKAIAVKKVDDINIHSVIQFERIGFFVKDSEKEFIQSC